MKKCCFLFLVFALCAGSPTFAQQPDSAACSGLPTHSQLKSALTAARTQSNGGFNLDMWGTLVNRDGVVCTVAFTGADRGSQWPGSRVISAQKANTANGLSLGHNSTPATSLFPSGLALSTGNLFSAVQPGGSLYGLQHSNPVDTDVSYGNSPGGAGNPPANGSSFGTTSDPLPARRRHQCVRRRARAL